MIHKLVLQNFKGIESAELTFERLTVLVGPNASGKTSVLQALELLAKLADSRTPRPDILAQRGGLELLVRRGSNTPLIVHADGSWAQQAGSVRVTHAHGGALAMSADVGGKNLDLIAGLKPNIFTNIEEKDLLESVLSGLKTSVLLRLSVQKLTEPSYAESANPVLQPDGSGLASVLAQMALSQPEDFSKLLQFLRPIIPQVERIRMSLTEVKRREEEILRVDDENITRNVTRTYPGYRLLLDMTAGAGLPPEAASEGTLLVLGLLTALMATPRPKLLLLDDLDRGLHPRAQRDLVAQFRKLLEQDPELQIIATSHSPYLLDNLDPKEVRLSNVLPDGTIRFAALTDHPDFERWKGVMHPGEFWSTVGEKWVGELRKEQTDG